MSAPRLSKQRASFTQIPNALLADSRLSLKAKGLYCLLSSKPEGWVYREGALMQESRDGRDGFRAAVKELIDYSWLQKVKVKDKAGRFVRSDWYLSCDGKPLLSEAFVPKADSAETDTSTDGKPVAGKTVAGKTGGRKSRPLSNTKGSNTDYSNTELSMGEDLVETKPAGRSPKQLRGESFGAWCGRTGNQGVPAAWREVGTLTLRMVGGDPRDISRQVARFEDYHLRGNGQDWLSEDWANELNKWLRNANANRRGRQAA